MVMTQQLIANMLGVPREGATEGAFKLQKAGLIDYRAAGFRCTGSRGTL
jgi:hypothetical protein